MLAVLVAAAVGPATATSFNINDILGGILGPRGQHGAAKAPQPPQNSGSAKAKESHGGLFGLDAYTLAEDLIAKLMPGQIGPADRYTVKLDRNGSSLWKGILSHVDVTGLNVRTADGLSIPRLDIHLDGLKVNLLGRSLESVARGIFTAALDGDAVTRYVQQRAGVRVRNIQVAIRNGQLVVKGTPEVIGVGLPTEVAGVPQIDGKEHINFRARKVAIFGVSLPQFAVHALEDRVNPLADLSHLNIPVRITELKVVEDHLLANGNLDVSKLRGHAS